MIVCASVCVFVYVCVSPGGLEHRLGEVGLFCGIEDHGRVSMRIWLTGPGRGKQRLEA